MTAHESDAFETMARRAGGELRLADLPEGGAARVRRSRSRRRGAKVVLASIVVVGLSGLIAMRLAGPAERTRVDVVRPPDTTATTLGNLDQRLLLEHGTLATRLVWAPDGRTLVTMSESGTVRAWRMPTGTELWSRPLPNAAKAMGLLSGVQVAIDPSGTTVGVGFDGAFEDRFLDLSDGSSAPSFEVPVGPEATDPPTVMSPDGRYRVELGRFRPSQVIEVASGETVVTMGEGNATGYTAAFDLVHRRVALKTDHTIEIWSLDSGDRIGGFTLPDYNATAEQMAFSPDGTLLAFTVENRVIVEPAR